jgi:hypothetical protein
MRKIREEEVKFTLEVEPEYESVRGNLICTGDEKEDRRFEDEIIAQLNRGDIWAWCIIRVTATYTLPDGTTVSGSDSLGCCSFRDEQDFKTTGYYDDMKREALAYLESNIEAQIKRGKLLTEIFGNV